MFVTRIRKYSLRIFPVILMLFLLASCREKDTGEIGTPFSKVQGLVATPWEVSQVIIVDGADPAQAQKDFSEYYLGGEQKLTLNFYEDRTFEITPGEGLNFLPDAGIWEFDDVNYPTKIILNPEGDTQILNLESPTRIIETELRLRFDKYICTVDGEVKPVYSYRLIFKRVNG